MLFTTEVGCHRSEVGALVVGGRIATQHDCSVRNNVVGAHTSTGWLFFVTAVEAEILAFLEEAL